MKTIKVIYTDTPLTKEQIDDGFGSKKYAFNTEYPVKIGDYMELPGYNTPVQVVKIYRALYDFYDPLGKVYVEGNRYRDLIKKIKPLRMISSLEEKIVETFKAY